MNAGLVVALLFLGMWCALLLAIVTHMFRSRRSRLRNVEAVAARAKGRGDRPLFDLPSLRLDVDGVPGEMRIRTQPDTPHTRLHFSLSSTGCLRISRQGGWLNVNRLFASQDIEVGEKSFDDRFLIQGSPEPWVRETLTPALRRRLVTLEALGRLNLQAGPAGLFVEVQRDVVSDRDLLDGFVRHSVEIVRELRRQQRGRVAVAPVAGLCPVCYGPMETEATPCPRCATPHHAACWNYFGGCAIYACDRR